MLSILIPVYNYEVGPLLMELYKQSKELGLIFEILVYDDGSKSVFKESNQKLDSLYSCYEISYKELPKNLGRSKIRNLLGNTAQYKYLLFLDCDSAIPSHTFIKDFMDASIQGDIVYGGTIYKDKPINDKKILHWTFGCNREMKSAEERNKKPYLSFTSNNFLIKKSLFLKYRFDETIRGYGYEDLVFSAVLKSSHLDIFHIDNPVVHLGLEDADIYLSKTENALKNLVQLQNTDRLKSTRLTDFYRRLEQYHVLGFFLFFYKKREKQIIKNLNSNRPRLRNLDLFKLAKYHYIRTGK